MNDGFKRLEESKNIAREKYLELYVKIPEVFILATSVVMIYLSTIPNIKRGCFYWISVGSFLLVLTSSLLILFKIKEIHRSIWILADGSLRKLKKAKTKSEIDNIVKKAVEESNKKILRVRQQVDLLLKITFGLFILGLLIMIFSSY